MDNNEFRETAISRLKNHEYKMLAKGERTEVWICRNPKSICYAFVISLTPLGVSVVGDIGNYTFNVARDMDFLAGDDINYYILSKLDHIHKNTIFNKDYFRETIMDQLRVLFDDYDEFYKHINSDYFLANINNKHSSFEDFISHEIENIKDGNFKDELIDTLREASYIEDNYSAHLFIRDNEFLSMWDNDYGYLCTADTVIQDLYLINEAARNIIKLGENNE